MVLLLFGIILIICYSHVYDVLASDIEKSNFSYKCDIKKNGSNRLFNFSNIYETVGINAEERNFNESFSCKWIFTSPADKYGFKVVITKMNTSLPTHFLIQNSTNIIAYDRNLILYHPYYNSDNSIEINFSKNNSLSVTSLKFKAYVTIVEKKFKLINNENCINETNDNGYSWWYEKYEPNFRCTFDLLIPPLTEMIVAPSVFDLEIGVDNIKYYFDQYNNSDIIHFEDYFILTPYTNGSERHVLFEFLSDGSIQNRGFEMTFTKLVCQCLNESIPCDDGNKYSLMPSRTPNYCGNLHCYIKLAPCKGPMTFLSLYSQNENPLNDVFNFFSNDVKVFEINSQNRWISSYNVYFNSSNENILEAITYPTKEIKSMEITSMSYYPSTTKKLHIKFSSAISYFILDTGLWPITALDIVDFHNAKEQKIFIYVNYFTGYFFIYNNESLTYLLTPYLCFNSKINFKKCEISKIHKFVIFVRPITITSISLYPLVVIRESGRAKGCVFKENIFILNFYNINITAIANNEDFCDIVILVDEGISFSYSITYLWTTAEFQDVKVFIGVDKSKLFFKFKFVAFNTIIPSSWEIYYFSSKTADKWNAINLFSKIYIVEIPKNSAIFLTLINMYNTNNYLKLTSSHSQTMIATPRYGTAKINFIPTTDHLFMYLDIRKNIVKLTVLDYELPKNYIFYLMANNTAQANLTTTGQSLIFQNCNLTFHFDSDKHNETNGVLIFAEFISEQPSLLNNWEKFYEPDTRSSLKTISYHSLLFFFVFVILLY